MIAWLSRPLTASALGALSPSSFFLLTSLSDDAAFSWSGLPMASLNFDSPSCLQLWSPRPDTLRSWQCFSDVMAVSGHPCLFSRCPLTSLSLGIPIFWHLFLLRPSSLDTSFSQHPILLTRFFLTHVHPFVFTSLFVWNLFLSKLPSLGTFLCLEVDVHSHVFLFASFSPGIPFLLNFKVLLRTTKLAQSTSKYYLVLRSLHPSTTSYYEACTQYSKYYFVLQSLREALPSTTSSKTCTNYIPVLLCPTKLAIKGPDNPTCQLLPTSSKRKVKIAWGKQEREKIWWRIGAEQVVCGRLSTGDWFASKSKAS